jgi:hypothetical protein
MSPVDGAHTPKTREFVRTAELAAHPADWMPWNYRDTLQKLAAPRKS